MADRFYGDIEVPEIASDPGPAAPGFVRVFGRAGKLFVRGAVTAEIDLTGGGGVAADKNCDGGFANSVYLPTQSIDGGDANG